MGIPSASSVVRRADRDWAVGVVDGRVVIGLFRRTPVLAGANAYLEEGQRAAAQHPDGITFLTVAQDPGPPPDGVTRQVFARMMTDFEGPSMASAILVLGGSTLGGSVVRSVVTGLLLLARHKTPTRVFGDPADAAAWMGEHARARGMALAPPDMVVAALGELRTRAGA